MMNAYTSLSLLQKSRSPKTKNYDNFFLAKMRTQLRIILPLTIRNFYYNYKSTQWIIHGFI